MRVVAVLHAIGSRAQGAGCRGKVGAVTVPGPSARCPPPPPPPPTSLQEPTQETSRGEQLMQKAGGQGPGRRHPGRML